MKKLILLLVPIVALMVACNNKVATTETVASADSTKVEPAKDTSNPGTGIVDVQVWEDKTGVTVSGATVAASQGGNLIETATSDEKGTYSFTKLTAGKTYNFKATKTGYGDSTITAVYSDNNSNPKFPLKKK